MVIPLALEKRGIGLVHMAVDHDGGAVLVQQGPETFEPAVGDMLLVAHTADRGVGEENIETAGGTEIPAERPDPVFHLLLGIHIDGIRPVTQAAAEAENPDPFELHDLSVRTEAALRRLLGILVIVVAVDVDHRRIGEACDE